METVRFAQGGDPSLKTDASAFPLSRNHQLSEWLDNNENHDSNHQEGRNLVDNTVKLLRVSVAVLGKFAGPPYELAVHRRQNKHQDKLRLQPAGPVVSALEGEPQACHPGDYHRRVD